MESEKLKNLKTVGRLLRKVKQSDLSGSAKNKLSSEITNLIFDQDQQPIKKNISTCDKENVLKFQIEKLIELDAPWEKLEPLLWEDFEASPVIEKAVQFIELLILKNQVSQIEIILKKIHSYLGQNFSNFYWMLHSKIRTKILLELWKNKKAEWLGWIILKSFQDHELNHAEKLLLATFWMDTPDPTMLLKFYERFHESIEIAIRDYGDIVDWARDHFYFELAKRAMDIGMFEKCRHYLMQVPQASEYFPQVIELIKELGDTEHSIYENHFRFVLESESHWQRRIGKLESFLQEVERQVDVSYAHHLNELLQDPLTLFPSIPEAWSALSSLLYQYKKLENKLSNILSVFYKNANQFHGPILDPAIWQGPALDYEENKSDSILAAITLVHHFVDIRREDEMLLWEAREILMRLKNDRNHQSENLYRSAIQGAMQWVSQTNCLKEDERSKMLCLLRVTNDPYKVLSQDLNLYLEKFSEPSWPVLNIVLDMALSQKNDDLLRKVLTTKAKVFGYTNHDLSHLAQSAMRQKNYDLFWRVITVLESRAALSPIWKSSWEISGEKRNIFEVYPLERENLEKLLEYLPKKYQLIAKSILTIGPALDDLMFMLEQPSRSNPLFQNMTTPIRNSEDVTQYINSSVLGIASNPDKIKLKSTFRLPAFAQNLPDHLWSRVLHRLCHVLGVSSSLWKMGQLCSVIDQMQPQWSGSLSFEKPSTSKLEQWMRSLTTEQEQAWHDWISLCREKKQTEIEDGVAMTIILLTQIICSQNWLALSSIRLSKTSLSVIKQIENFILVDFYDALRKNRKHEIQMSVPHSLVFENFLHDMGGKSK